MGQALLSGLALLLIAGHADAQRRGGGFRGGGGGFRGGGFSRGAARSSVTRPSFNRPSFSRPSAPISNVGAINRGNVIQNRPGNVGNIANRPGNIYNRPGNIYNRPGNIYNRPIDVGDVNVIGGGRWDNNWDGCCYYGSRWGAAAVGYAAGTIAASSLGSVVYELPPTTCTSTVVNGITYQQCGDTWYKPEFTGTTVSYVVVSPP